MSVKQEEIMFDPIGIASVEVVSSEGDEWEVGLNVRFSAEQAEMFFKRFMVNRETPMVRVEKGP